MKKIVALVLSLVMVLGLATTAFGAADSTLYYQNDASTGDWQTVTTYTGKLPADLVVDADVGYSTTTFEQTGGNVEYYDFVAETGYVGIEVPKAAADYKLVCGGIEIYLTLVPDAAVAFEAEVEAFTGVTNDDEACGSLYVAKKDLSKTYYVAYTEKGLPQAYYVKSATGSANVLVGDEIVKANPVTTFVTHKWVGNEVNATTKAYTSLICENCGRVAKLYANADAAGKYSVYMAPYGWITAADAGYAPQAVETPAETEKVESAQTFDAGIAMYVGMSVMAAAGSAVVLKKKD